MGIQTVIVPVDFSESALNAAKYAVKLFTGRYGVNMVLHHVYEKDSNAAEANLSLENVKAMLLENGIVKISTLAEQGDDFLIELEKLARHRNADLIVMGITERTAIGQSLLSSNALKILNTKVCPVLIVPPETSYHDVKNVLLTSDFKDVMDSTPSVPIRNFLKTFHPKLHILNVSNEHYVSLTEEYQQEKEKLKQMFEDLNPEFYFLGMNDVDEAINQFAADKKIDLTIIIHKEQSILSRLFIKSHTKKLAYQSNIPIMAIHE
ncbi:MAG TPA: universal stress protein [Chitinophagaceae bacterium]|nr:universal stress protein [Chitinophagaceae bacterium]